jgi:hypothetical protein
MTGCTGKPDAVCDAVCDGELACVGDADAVRLKVCVGEPVTELEPVGVGLCDCDPVCVRVIDSDEVGEQTSLNPVSAMLG